MNTTQKPIVQSCYGTITLDDTQKDHVQIWNDQPGDPQVNQIERNRIWLLVEQLTNIMNDDSKKNNELPM